MLNLLARFLLVLTSLSPVLGAVAVNQFSQGRPLSHWLTWLLAAVMMVVVCALVLRYAEKSAQKQTIMLASLERDGKESLAFLVAYLLPLFASEKLGFNGDWMTGAYILGVIFLVVAHSGNLSFNPVMGLLGYHFYSIRTQEGVCELLISREELRRPWQALETVELACGIRLHTGEGNA